MILNFNRLDYTSTLKGQIRAVLGTLNSLFPEKNNHVVLDARGKLYVCKRRRANGKVWHISRC